jgi:hypothetical protein
VLQAGLLEYIAGVASLVLTRGVYHSAHSIGQI